MKQNPGARLTMMRSDTETPYSGMLPSDIAVMKWSASPVGRARCCAATGRL